MPSTRPSEAERALPALGLINVGLWLFCLTVVLVPLGTVAFYGLASGRLELLAEPEVATAAWNSLSSAVLSGVLAVLIALGLVLVIEHTRLPGRATLRILALSPLLIPPFIGAISWIGLFGPSGMINSAAEDLVGRPL